MSLEQQGQTCLSTYTKEYTDKKRTVVFNSLNPFSTSFSVESSFWKAFKKDVSLHQNTTLYQTLRQMGLLITSARQDIMQLGKAREDIEKSIPNSPTTLYLVLTDDCNMRCDYCPFSNSPSIPHDTSYMDKEVVKKAIDFWVDSLDKNTNTDQLGIIFYGGEPLLNLSALGTALDYTHKLKREKTIPENTRLLLDTNGLTLTNNVAQILKRYNAEVTVALDSFSTRNDKFRKDVSRKGTYERVLKTLIILKTNNIPTYLSMSVNPASPISPDTLFEKTQQYGIRGVGINILRGKNFSTRHQRQSSRALLSFYIQNSQKDIYEFQTTRREKAFFSGKNFLNCGGFGEHVVVHPDGKVGNCPWTSDYTSESIFNLKNYNDVKKHNFYSTRKKDLPHFNSDCLKCEAISICGGKCVWAEDQSSKQNQSYCYLSKEMIKMLVSNNKTDL